MTRFTNRFISLMENMKSNNTSILNERREKTAAGRDAERTERRTERAEDKFKSGSEFNIRAFIKALEMLVAQVSGESDRVSLAISTNSDGSKYAGPIIRKLDSILGIVDNLLRNAEDLFKREGGKLEKKDDQEIMDTWRAQYQKAKTDYITVAKDWSAAIVKQTKERPVDQDNIVIEKEITEAMKLFDAARSLLIASASQFVSSQGGNNSSNNSGSSSGSSITEEIKERDAVYTGKEGETVIEVKKLIYTKFGKYPEMSSSTDWKKVYKSWPTVSATLRANTAKVIKGAKAGLADDYPEFKTDTSGNITPKFLDALRAVKEGLSSNPGKIVSFELFMKNRVNEGFNPTAAGKVLSTSSTSTNSGSSSSSSTKPKVTVPDLPATPFKTEVDGNTFREWVNKNHADWAKSNDLSTTGPKDNSYIRKAYNEFGEEYKKASEAPKSVTKSTVATNAEMNSLLKKIQSSGSKCELRFASDDNSPCILYWSGKEYGYIFNNYRVTYTTSVGRKYVGTYNFTTNNVKFDNGKTFDLTKWVTTCKIADQLASESATTAQGKKAYVASSGEGYVNVRSSAEANTGTINNLIYKHTDKSTPIGLLLSSTVTKSDKIGDKTWYKIQFPTKQNGYETGWVRSDTVDLK